MADTYPSYRALVSTGAMKNISRREADITQLGMVRQRLTNNGKVILMDEVSCLIMRDVASEPLQTIMGDAKALFITTSYRDLKGECATPTPWQVGKLQENLKPIDPPGFEEWMGGGNNPQGTGFAAYLAQCNVAFTADVAVAGAAVAALAVDNPTVASMLEMAAVDDAATVAVGQQQYVPPGRRWFEELSPTSLFILHAAIGDRKGREELEAIIFFLQHAALAHRCLSFERVSRAFEKFKAATVIGAFQKPAFVLNPKPESDWAQHTAVHRVYGGSDGAVGRQELLDDPNVNSSVPGVFIGNSNLRGHVSADAEVDETDFNFSEICTSLGAAVHATVLSPVGPVMTDGEPPVETPLEHSVFLVGVDLDTDGVDGDASALADVKVFCSRIPYMCLAQAQLASGSPRQKLDFAASRAQVVHRGSIRMSTELRKVRGGIVLLCDRATIDAHGYECEHPALGIVDEYCVNHSRIKSGHTDGASRLATTLWKMYSAVDDQHGKRQNDVADTVHYRLYGGMHPIPFREGRAIVLAESATGAISLALSRRLYAYGPTTTPYHLLAIYVGSLKEAKYFGVMSSVPQLLQFEAAYSEWTKDSWMETPYAAYLYGAGRPESIGLRSTMDKMWGIARGSLEAMPDSSHNMSVGFQREAKAKGSSSIVGGIAAAAYAGAIRMHLRQAVTTKLTDKGTGSIL